MTVKLGSLRADVRKVNEGDWVVVPELPGVRLRVRGLSYGPYQMELSQVAQRLMRRYGKEPIPPEVNDREMGRLYNKHILLEWDGFDEPYAPERALDALTDPAFGELRMHVGYAARKVGEAEIDFVEDAAKN